MKATGIVRRIDDLGRVVIPKEIRRTMRIREGDPLEIYTDREGEVIFKKYSPIGELASFASRKEYAERTLSEEMEKLMEGRGVYAWREGSEKVYPTRETGNHFVSCAMPIVSEGDVVGCVASLMSDEEGRGRDALGSDVESKLILTAAGFLGRQLES